MSSDDVSINSDAKPIAHTLRGRRRHLPRLDKGDALLSGDGEGIMPGF